MPKDAKYSGEREIKTFVSLNKGADDLIQKTKEIIKGSGYTTMGALLLTAFTFEAYLNHLGEYHFNLWKEADSIKIWDKYETLYKKLEFKPDYSRRPHQTLKSLFSFRNTMAHGRTEIIEKEKIVSSQNDPYEHRPKARWEEYCTLENAERAKNDIEKIIIELHQKAGLGDYPFTHGIGSYTLSLKKK